MSNKLEAALGGNTFTDDQGVTFEAQKRQLVGEWEGHTQVIDLKRSSPDWLKPDVMAFWAEDADAIIDLIKKAAA